MSIGSTIKAVELFENIRKIGHQVKMCWLGDLVRKKSTQPGKPTLQSFFQKQLIFWLHDPKAFLKNGYYYQKEIRHITSFKPDLVVDRLDYLLFSSLFSARRYNLPFILEADAPCVYEAVKFHPQFGRIVALSESIEKFMLTHADHVVTQSEDSYTYFIEKYQLDENKISWISNGADVEKIKPMPKDPHLCETYHLKNQKVIGFIGSMSAWHGVDNMIQIFQKILDDFKDVLFLIVGTGGKDEEKIRRYLAKSENQSRVILTGYVPHEDIQDYLSLMDIVLAPYPHYDFFHFSPVKIFEYMAAQKPVITSPLGQIRQIIQDNQNGCFCNAENTEEMADKIRYLLRNPKEADRMARNARQTIVEKYSWKSKAEAWETICQDVWKRHKNKYKPV